MKESGLRILLIYKYFPNYLLRYYKIKLLFIKTELTVCQN